MNIAWAHGTVADGHAAPISDLLWAWTADPVFLIPLVAAVLYFRGLRAYRRGGGRRFPPWRPVAFAAGIGLMGLALLSPVDALADFSFTWHMVQHSVIIVWAVPLVLLGAPFLPVVRGLPQGLREGAFIPLARQQVVRAVAVWITRPVPALAIYQATLLLWHLPPLYDAALTSASVHYLEHLCFVVAAVLFWWNVINPYPFPPSMHFLVRVGYLFLAAVFNTVLSASLTFADEVLYGYAALGGFWGMTMLEDQRLGGMLMWVVGGGFHLIAMILVFAVYAHQESRKEPPRALYITETDAA